MQASAHAGLACPMSLELVNVGLTTSSVCPGSSTRPPNSPAQSLAKGAKFRLPTCGCTGGRPQSDVGFAGSWQRNFGPSWQLEQIERATIDCMRGLRGMRHSKLGGGLPPRSRAQALVAGAGGAVGGLDNRRGHRRGRLAGLHTSSWSVPIRDTQCAACCAQHDCRALPVQPPSRRRRQLSTRPCRLPDFPACPRTGGRVTQAR